ncbi:HTH-type transcriptional regulator / antitoxin HigA [Robiginitalea myxolifaciens]|uniref:HTH-type transcriptional regulator / antitoxin HigA n=1 Tax=Robiginitalea myxolifaciens TaxID=400055 RepID=A0A1I6G3S5_9FLAO|nr:HigA family addiction module antitoxin [Robiginitalea myxolifaciens]SFR36854.1 HTH-type transcriptional regulator / antitoxin HigA [Robiginitalea myxolifaciens]
MPEMNSHPGEVLNKLMLERDLTQRELAANIDVSHTVLNSIIKGNRNINISLALSLEAANFRKASYWMDLQLKYSLAEAKKDSELVKKNHAIRIWNELDDEWVPISYLKKHVESLNTPDDLDKLFDIYGVADEIELKKKISNYPLKLFRKSSKFEEKKTNVIAWSALAEFKARNMKVCSFKVSDEDKLISSLNRCFYKNRNTLKETTKILSDFGIKFAILDRPPKTPVEGKSFMSEGNPAIFMSLKYKRLDNFAFGLLHELGHVYRHLVTDKFKEHNFFTGNSELAKLEREADLFAQNKLIPEDLWLDFYLENEEFNDEVIGNFARKNKINPCIVRGRVCFEDNLYYRKRSIYNSKNVLT